MPVRKIQAFAAQGASESGVADVRKAVQAPDLVEVIRAWLMLSPEARVSILAAVRADVALP